MKKIGFLSLLAACIFAACSESDSSVDEQPTPKRLITVEVSENPLTDEATGAPVLGITRTANYTTTESLHEFSMNYTGSYKYDFTKSGTWTSSPSVWPESVENNAPIDFYAYTGGTFNYNDGNPYVAFTVNLEASTQHDLLVAVHKNIAYSDAGGNVSLSFDHACAVVQFNVQLTNTLSNTYSSITVKSIKLKNVKMSGQYHYANEDWKSVETLADFNLTNGEIGVTTTLQELSSGYLFLIPQTLGSDAKLTVTYMLGQTQKDYDISLAGKEWSKGYKYVINIRLGTSIIQ